ncbi:hypothetical protein [Pyrobaculum aerophilum]|uniref:Uncharacterized protein n=1 Tax=Pyrobaculum aerophilum TaxID=13773 RepID=A0A371QU68_9CREN|nr:MULTISPECIES: hypothetical protein [Pyrobaculum]MCX8137226.1 hypothetical protein [Pyrobaculum aerophilum]RFA92691.1 hypothetical protein CGL51_14010 [Pyrobaculum aerophilum]RFA98672.1 hypothetical protein CGL52_06555 [Pyrobaculum aerophilum]HII47966.1 hypothetical protein [Pyrobaculum aerophilum]
MSFEALLKHYEQVKKDLERLYTEVPEAIDGLLSLYNGEEDYTCFTAKKLMGKRDKGVQRSVFL